MSKRTKMTKTPKERKLNSDLFKYVETTNTPPPPPPPSPLSSFADNAFKKLSRGVLVSSSSSSSLEPCSTTINILVFDVETTGFIKKTNDINEQPYILQLSFIVYEKHLKMSKSSVKKIYNEYIKIPNNVFISEEITQLTGITKEICMERGKKMSNVISDFYDAYKECDYVVSHNLDFDGEMVMLEIYRNKNVLHSLSPSSSLMFNKYYNMENQITKYCTMQFGKKYQEKMLLAESSLSSLKGIAMVKNTYVKYPKLVELYQKLFGGKTPQKLHDSLIDTFVCFCCFMKIEFNLDVDENTMNIFHNYGFKEEGGGVGGGEGGEEINSSL